MIDPCKKLAADLAGDGFHCQFQEWNMVVSQQTGPVWPNRGNSFWVTHIDGTWYLFTWIPVAYRVPTTSDMAMLSRACMAYGKQAMGKVPPQILQEFRLVELSKEEWEALDEEPDKQF